MTSRSRPSPRRSAQGGGQRATRRDARGYAAGGVATVAAIYALGYAVTEPSVQHRRSQGVSAIAHPAASPPARAYRDGAYHATGSSTYGEISVALSVRGGRVASVEVTGATTFFPTSEVEPLIPEVISRQSANVDVVSGATGSSEAFRGAVQQALSQARA